jgi:hypothetical protein
MLERKLMAVLLALIAIFAIAGLVSMGTICSSVPAQNRPSNETTSSANNPTQSNEESVSLVQIWERTERDPVAFFTFFLAIFSAALVLVAVLQIWLLFRAEGVATNAANAAKQSAVIAERALVAGQRAFVHLEDITFEVVDNWVSDSDSGPGISVYNVPRNIGKMIRTKFSFTNSGNTPTKLLKIMLHCQLVGLIGPTEWSSWNVSLRLAHAPAWPAEPFDGVQPATRRARARTPRVLVVCIRVMRGA